VIFTLYFAFTVGRERYLRFVNVASDLVGSNKNCQQNKVYYLFIIYFEKHYFSLKATFYRHWLVI